MFVSVHQIKQLFLPALTDWFYVDEPLQSAQPSSWLSLKPLWMPKLSLFFLVTPSSWQCDKGSLAPQRGGSHSALDAGWREARRSSSSWESMDGVMPLPERKREILCFLEGFPVALVVKNSPPNTGGEREVGSNPGSARSLGGGHGNPLQYSCLENPMDRGAWQTTVHGVAKRHDWSDLARIHMHGLHGIPP